MPAQQLTRLTSYADQQAFSLRQVVIRLGPRANASRYYSTATELAMTMLGHMGSVSPSFHDAFVKKPVWFKVAEERDKARQASAAFVDEAYTIAHSVLK
jgi:hypothetical protein